MSSSHRWSLSLPFQISAIAILLLCLQPIRAAAQGWAPTDRSALNLSTEDARLLDRIQIDTHFGGICNDGTWLPITIRLTSTTEDPPLRGTVRFVGNLYHHLKETGQMHWREVLIDVPIEIESQAVKEIDVYLPIDRGRMGGADHYGVVIQLESPKSKTFPPISLPFQSDYEYQVTFLTVSNSSNRFLRFRNYMESAHTEAIEASDSGDLNNQGYGYNAIRGFAVPPYNHRWIATVPPSAIRPNWLSLGPIDCLILHQIQWDELAPEQQETILQWTAQGRTLVLSQAPGARTLSTWIQAGAVPGPDPGPEAQTIPARQWHPNAPADASFNITPLGTDRDRGLFDIRPLGFGKVVLLAVDLAEFPEDLAEELQAPLWAALSPRNSTQLWGKGVVLPSADRLSELLVDAIAKPLQREMGLPGTALKIMLLMLLVYSILIGPALWYWLRKGDRLQWFGPAAAAVGLLIFALTPAFGALWRENAQYRTTVHITQVTSDLNWAGIYTFDLLLPSGSDSFQIASGQSEVPCLELGLSETTPLHAHQDGNIQPAPFTTAPWTAKAFKSFTMVELTEEDRQWLAQLPPTAPMVDPTNPWQDEDPDRAPVSIPTRLSEIAVKPFQVDPRNLTLRQETWESLRGLLNYALRFSNTETTNLAIFGASLPSNPPRTTLEPAPETTEQFQVILLPE